METQLKMFAKTNDFSRPSLCDVYHFVIDYVYEMTNLYIALNGVCTVLSPCAWMQCNSSHQIHWLVKKKFKVDNIFLLSSLFHVASFHISITV